MSNPVDLTIKLSADVAELWRLDGACDEIVREGVWYAADIADPARLDLATARLRLPRTSGLAGRACSEGGSISFSSTHASTSAARTRMREQRREARNSPRSIAL